MPLCDQTGVPGLVGLTHFHSSTTSGSASFISLRIRLRVSPRQSPSSAILFEMSSEADWLWFAPDFLIFSSSPSRQALAGVACRRRHAKYESPQSTPVAAAQPHASGPSPTATWAMSAEARLMAKPAYAHSLSRAGNRGKQQQHAEELGQREFHPEVCSGEAQVRERLRHLRQGHLRVGSEAHLQAEERGDCPIDDGLGFRGGLVGD